MEDKQKILDHLKKALQATDNASDLIGLTYIPDKEFVIMYFEKGMRVVNVHMDSGTAMIRDVLRHIGC